MKKMEAATERAFPMTLRALNGTLSVQVLHFGIAILLIRAKALKYSPGEFDKSDWYKRSAALRRL